MKASKEFLKTFIWKEFDLPSKSEKGVLRKVVVMKNGDMQCNCIAGQMNRECRHKRILKKQLSGQTYAR